MARKQSAEPSIPAAARPVYDAIMARIEPFCREHLNNEYLALCRRLVGVLARKRPSPLTRGKPEAWAAGIVRAIGSVNFPDDLSRKLQRKKSAVDAASGVSQATGQAKAKALRDLLDRGRFDPDWTLPSLIEQNPMAWFIQVNGLVVDARQAPRKVQEEAFHKGLIPYIPGIKPVTENDTDKA